MKTLHYQDAEKRFKRERFDVNLEGPDDAGKFTVSTAKHEGGDGPTGYAITPDLAIWQAWTLFDAARSTYGR